MSYRKTQNDLDPKTVLAQDFSVAHRRCAFAPTPANPAVPPMAGELEAKFAQMTVDAKCPPAFVAWLANQSITTMETYGRVAASEDKLDTKVDAVFTSYGGKFDSIGQPTCIIKLWAACRAALCVDSSGALVQGNLAQHDGISEGTERTLKATWVNYHHCALPDGLLLSRAVMGKIHRELAAASPCLEVYPLERLRTFACFDPVNTATLLQIQPGRLVGGIEVVSDVVTGHLEV